ncbi:MAG: hypothetical protein ABSA53_26025 [Streptosporangiaceae bacterium]|jgi:hypothetical protein
MITTRKGFLRGDHPAARRGVYVWPVTAFTKVCMIVGTAAVLVVVAVTALAVGTVLRRSAAADRWPERVSGPGTARRRAPRWPAWR